MVEKAVVERVEAESPIVIVIMVDGWTDGHAHHPYVNMSTQYLTKDFEMRDWNLGIEPVERSHTIIYIILLMMSKIMVLLMKPVPSNMKIGYSI